MFGLRRSLVPFVFALWTLAAGDAEVTCVFMERCVLPCSFQSDSDVVIDWIKTGGNLPVHSYSYNQDQLVQQDQNFRNRTSLFKEQISRGNASLQLTGVQVQDQGRYKCYTSPKIWGEKDSFIKLKLDAPVSKIHIEQVGNRITCSSEGIYPEPVIIWSTDPPFTFKNTTRVQQTEQQLYNISSSLILSDHVPDVDYSCSISTRRNSRRATLRLMLSVNGSSSETSIKCTASDSPITDFSLIWRFNPRQIILNQTRTDVPYTVTEEWRKHVKSVSESGSLMLQDLSSHQEGKYTCELSSNEETIITNSFVRIEQSKGNPARVAGMVGGAAIAILVHGAAVICLVLYCKKKRGQKENDGSDSNLNKTELDRRQTRNEATTQQKHEDLTNATQPLSNKDSGHTSRP